VAVAEGLDQTRLYLPHNGAIVEAEPGSEALIVCKWLMHTDEQINSVEHIGTIFIKLFVANA